MTAEVRMLVMLAALLVLIAIVAYATDYFGPRKAFAWTAAFVTIGTAIALAVAT